MSPETLKELLDESVSESKGRTVADSIAERLSRPPAYKFSTDCSIIPVWIEILIFVLVIDIWSTENGDIRESDNRCSIHTVIIDPHGIRAKTSHSFPDARHMLISRPQYLK
ncbi:hypothetical protein Tco_0833429 [Tanacetum coccineum]